MIVILYTILVFLMTVWLLCVLWNFIGWHPKFLIPLCDGVMGWHIPSKERTFDGCSEVSTCKFCGKKILRDSQGNWFSYEVE